MDELSKAKPRRLWPQIATALALSILPLAQAAKFDEKNLPQFVGLADPAKIHLIYNNDVFGYLEPCGCRIDPVGGAYRRWNATSIIPKDSRISVDSGNLFFVSANPPGNMIPQWREQAKGMVDAYNALGWDLFAPGENDFALGLEELRKLEKQAKFDFISSNLVSAKNGKPLFKERVVLDRLGKRIGFFAIFHPGLRVPEGIEVKDPIETAKAQVKALEKKGVDWIVALTQQGLDLDEALAKAVPGIHLIVGSQSQSFLQKPRYEGKTAIVQLSSKGQVFGVVDLVEPKTAPTVDASVVVELDTRFDPIPEGETNPIKGLIAATNLKLAQISQEQSAALWANEAKKPAKLETFVQCRTCHQEQYAFHAKHPHSAAFLTLVAAHKERSLDCLKCHSVGLNKDGGFDDVVDAIRNNAGEFMNYEEILKFANLAKIREEKVSYRNNPERVKKDVAAWHEALQQKRASHVFVGVQCENCHGVMANHPFETKKPAKVTTQSCLQCHTVDQMPKWYDASGKPLESAIQKALKSISCPSMKR